MVNQETTQPVETPPEQKSQIETLAEMFQEEPEKGINGEPAETQTKGKPKGLKDAAERLGLKPEDLYAIEVPMSDGKVKTLGQLKDAAAKEGDLSVRELAFEESRTKRESDLIRAQSELRELVSALPASAVKPEVLEAVRQKHEAIMKRERAKTLEAIPEWQDEAKRNEEIEGIMSHLEGYGFPKNYLQTIYDHRALRYIRENFLRETRIRKALEQVQQVRPTSTPKAKSNGAAPKLSQPFSKKSEGGSAKLLDLLNN